MGHPTSTRTLILIQSGVNTQSGDVWETYGGKLVENIVQGVARDLLVTDMQDVTAGGHQIVTHVHYEIVIDEPLDSDLTIENVCQLMSELSAWAVGLPLTANGYECDFYKKM